MANRYFLNIGANWGDTANWSDTSGGTGGFSVPTNADDVFFDANSGNCTVNASNRVAKTLDFTGYTNTITMTFGITVSGSVTLVAAMTIAGASGLTINATGTFTSNGKTWPNALTFSATNTLTLADDLSVGGLLTTSGGTTTVNGTFNINASGGITISANLVQGIGTTTLNLTGGTWSGGGVVRINTNLNGNVIISGTVWFDTRTLTHLSGNITTSGSILRSLANVTYNTGSVVWNNITFDNLTYTLLSDLNINGNIGTLGTVTFNGTFNINSSGTFNIGNTIQQGTGVTTLNLLGGTWSTTSANGILRLNTNINGNITISGNVYYNTGTLTNLSGKTNANTATLNIAASSTFINCDKINFKTITITAATTQTFNRFFSGSALVPTRIQSGTAGTNYTITFQDRFEKITKFTKISNCTVTNRGQLLCITDKSNKGGNVGVRYINQMPNGLPKNNPSTTNPLGYATSTYLLSDPNTILI